MATKRKIRIISYFIISLIFTSCTTTLDINSRLDELLSGQRLVIPIGGDTLGLNDLLTNIDTAKYIGTEGKNIFIKYKDTINWIYPTFDFYEMVSPDPDEVKSNFLIPVALTKDTTYVFPHKMPLDFADAHGVLTLNRVEMENTKLQITVLTENLNISPSNISITAKFPSNFFRLESTGDTVVLHQPTQFGVAEDCDIPAYAMFSDNGITEIPMDVHLTIKVGGFPILINPNSKISLLYKFTDANARIYYGKFKPNVLIAKEEQAFDLTPHLIGIPTAGVFKLAEPQLDLDIENTSGIGMDLTVDSIKVFKENDPSFIPVYATFNSNKSNKYTIARKQLITDPAPESNIHLDYTSGNGAISHFFDKFPLPDKIYYNLHLNSNYKTGDPLEFLRPDDKFIGKLSVKIPLKLNSGSEFTVNDTIRKVDFYGLIDLEGIDTVQFVFKMVNSFPIKGKLSMKFLDAQKQPIDNLVLLSDSIISAPELTSEGEVVEGKSSTSYIILKVNKSQINNLIQIKNIAYSLKIESDENKKITFQKDNQLIIRLGVFLKSEQIFNFE